MRSALISVLIALSSPVYATPAGKPPKTPMSFHQVFYGCQLPLEITLQAKAAAYRGPVQPTRTLALPKGSRVTVLDAIDVVHELGLAKVVDPNFEHNDGALRQDDEVYVLADWEMLYSHAWVNGAEVEGGLPTQDKSYFSVIQAPKVEHWVLVHSNLAPRTDWWLRVNDASRDTHAIETCKRIQGF